MRAQRHGAAAAVEDDRASLWQQRLTGPGGTSCTVGRDCDDLVIAAELLGHARLETTRVYTRPTAEDRSKAVDLLPVDQ